KRVEYFTAPAFGVVGATATPLSSASASDSLVSRLVCLCLVCLCLVCLCLVCLCLVCAGSLGRLCFLVPSGVEPHGRPRRGVGEIGRFVTAVGAAEDPTVVESVLLALPEFDLEDMDPEPAPMLGPRDVPTLELGLQLLPARHRLGLLGHGRTDLRAAGARSEVGVRVLGGGHLGAAADADLAFHVLPREVHGDAGIVAQLLAFGRVIVGEEEEA